MSRDMRAWESGGSMESRNGIVTNVEPVPVSYEMEPSDSMTSDSSSVMPSTNHSLDAIVRTASVDSRARSASELMAHDSSSVMPSAIQGSGTISSMVSGTSNARYPSELITQASSSASPSVNQRISRRVCADDGLSIPRSMSPCTGSPSLP